MNRRGFLFTTLSALLAPLLRGDEKKGLSQERLNTSEVDASKLVAPAPPEAKKAIKSGKRPTIYPFDVRIGGQLAEVTGNPETAIFARIPLPVAPDAEVEVDGAPGLLIINVFPVKPDGNVPQGAPIKVMMQQSANRLRLSETMDKSVLEPGLWGANIVFLQTTSRVMFEVK